MASRCFQTVWTVTLLTAAISLRVLPDNQHVQNILFAGGEPIHAGSEFDRRPLPFLFRVASQGFADVIEEDLAVQGFFQEIERPGLECPGTGGNVAVGGNEDDGQFDAIFRQALLNFQTAHLGHPHVEHQAPGIVGGGTIPETPGPRERPAPANPPVGSANTRTAGLPDHHRRRTRWVCWPSPNPLCRWAT